MLQTAERQLAAVAAAGVLVCRQREHSASLPGACMDPDVAMDWVRNTWPAPEECDQEPLHRCGHKAAPAMQKGLPCCV